MKLIQKFLIVMLVVSLVHAKPAGPHGRFLEGETFVDFQFSNLDGKLVDSDIYRKDKLLFLKIGRLDCSMCNSLAGILGKLDQEYMKKGVAFLEVSLDTDVERLKQHKEEKGLDFETLMDPTGLVASYYQVEGLPTVLIVENKEKAKILYHDVGLVPETKLRKLLDSFTK